MAVSDDALEAALLLISDGQSLRFAARELEIPVTSLYVALAARRPEHYARARDAAAELDADQVKEIADRTLAGCLDPQAARVAIDALKWTAGKRSPRKFGDKLSLAGEPGAPAAISVQVELVRSGARRDS